MDLTPELFARAGRALFGDEWQVPLARRLNINERTVRRIAQAARNGEPYRMTPGWKADLVAALRERTKQALEQAKEASEIADILGKVRVYRFSVWNSSTDEYAPSARWATAAAIETFKGRIDDPEGRLVPLDCLDGDGKTPAGFDPEAQ